MTSKRRYYRRKTWGNEATPDQIPQAERDFQNQFLDLADMTGWSYWHFPKAAYAAAAGAWSRDRQINKGWPDWALLRLGKKPRFLLVELKGSKTLVTSEQVAVNEALHLCGIEAYIFRPSDWEKIVEVLQW